MQFLITFSLLIIVATNAHAKIEFQAQSQENRVMTVTIEKRLFSAKQMIVADHNLKIVKETAAGLIIAETGIQGQQLILVKGSDIAAVSATAEDFFWGQSWNKFKFNAALTAKEIAGTCDTRAEKLTGIIFKFSLPDSLGAIECLTSPKR